MRVLLIEYNPFQPVHTPISLGYLAAHLKKQGHAVQILNVGSNTELSIGGLSRTLLESRPDLIGFAAYQRNIFLIDGWAGLCKSVLPGCRILIGGPQATFLPTDSLEALPGVDYVCRSEGEVALQALVDRLGEDRPETHLPGWSGRDPDAELWDGGRLDAPEDLDTYPSPYLDGTLSLDGTDEAILLGSRGCPYRCAFCYTPAAFGRKIRYHSLDRILEEMGWILRQGVSRFWFADPSFTFQSDRIDGLLEAILSRDLKVQIWLETRADLVSGPLLRKMHRAGVHTLAYGLESASKQVLQRIRKPLKLEEVAEAIRLTQEAGIEVELFSQYGLPGETFQDALQTLRFVQDNGVSIQGNTNAQQMQIYFGTDIQKDYERFGIRPLAESSPAYLSIGSRYETDCMGASEIQEVGRRWKAGSADGGKHIVS